MYLQTLTSY